MDIVSAFRKGSTKPDQAHSGKEEKKVSGEALGAGSGGGGGIKPVAIIVADKDGVRVEPIKKGTATVVEKVGEVLGKIAEKRGEKKAE